MVFYKHSFSIEKVHLLLSSAGKWCHHLNILA